MSHHGGGGGGCGGGFGHGHHGHHGHSMHHGGEPDMSASWNMAYVGEKRTGRFANFHPFPIFLGLFAFSVMMLPFVMDWDEPHLQRLLIGHDLTAKEIAHRNAVDQMLAGAMRSKTREAFGNEYAGNMIPDAPQLSGSQLLDEGQGAQQAAPPQAQPQGGGLSGFSISSDAMAPAAGGAQARAYPQQNYSQMQQQLSPGMDPAQAYMQNYGQQQAMPQYQQQYAPQAQYAQPSAGFSNQQFASAHSAGFSGAGRSPGRGSGGVDYHAPRHRVNVER